MTKKLFTQFYNWFVTIAGTKALSGDMKHWDKPEVFRDALWVVTFDKEMDKLVNENKYW